MIGADGFHGVSRKSIPKGVLKECERVYPFGWLGVLSRTKPVSPELIYCKHERGFALCSLRSQVLSRYYIQVPLTDRVEDWPDDEFWSELRRRLPEAVAKALDHRAVDREEHRAAAQLRRRADALRPAVPRRRRRSHRAADRRAGLEQRGLRHLLSLPRADRSLRTKRRRRPRRLFQKALARVWKAQRFSWWLTMLLHRFPENSEYENRLQATELDYLFSSDMALGSLAENYVGLPF